VIEFLEVGALVASEAPAAPQDNTEGEKPKN
jgi:hypothetical protein